LPAPLQWFTQSKYSKKALVSTAGTHQDWGGSTQH
jgi:hypothetical protein